MTHSNYYEIKPTTIKDMNLVLDMRNKEYVRKSMISQNTISSENHQKWFTEMLEDHTKAYFIFKVDKTPAGVIGFYDISDERFANWSFYLESPSLPKGAGTNMCLLGLDKLFSDTNVLGIRTKILDNNVASMIIHKKLGFSKIRCENGKSMFELQREKWIDHD